MCKWIVFLGLAILPACGPDQGSTIRQRQDAALKDPFNYSPYDEPKGPDSTRQEIQKDLKSVFNP